MKAYKSIAADSQIELVINRSRFIGRCFMVTSEKEVTETLAAIRKQHYDASHNCYAYSLNENGTTARFSDDGEPGGTAGLPMMEVVKQKGVTDLLVIVTRYFGGILLGAGGLVRAYSGAASEAIDKAGIVEYVPAIKAGFEADYQQYAKLSAYLKQNADNVECEFLENVRFTLMVDERRFEQVSDGLYDMSLGKCRLAPCGEGYIKRCDLQ